MTTPRPVHLVPIPPEKFRGKMHTLFRYNMEPFSVDELQQSEDGLHCPACGKLRYAMWQAVNSQYNHLFLFTGSYCTCLHTGGEE